MYSIKLTQVPKREVLVKNIIFEYLQLLLEQKPNTLIVNKVNIKFK